MARRITDRDKNRTVKTLSFGEGFLAPRPPVHRIIRMLAEV
jgi:hypothetical protein